MTQATGFLLERVLQTRNHCKRFLYPTEMEIFPTQENNFAEGPESHPFVMESSREVAPGSLFLEREGTSRWQAPVSKHRWPRHRGKCVNSEMTQRAGCLPSINTPSPYPEDVPSAPSTNTPSTSFSSTQMSSGLCLLSLDRLENSSFLFNFVCFILPGTLLLIFQLLIFFHISVSLYCVSGLCHKGSHSPLAGTAVQGSEGVRRCAWLIAGVNSAQQVAL